jgi:4-hydroxybenzoate polyprenyltransferase
MSNSIYKINKGINKPIEFKGLKAQYIWYLAAGVLALLILFAILYILGINPFICLAFVGISGAILVIQIYRLSKTYGEHGLSKKLAYRQVPHAIRLKSRSVFRKVKTTSR